MTRVAAACALDEIVAALGGELTGGDPASRGATRIDRLGSIGDADATTLTFLASPRLAPQLATSAAACVIVGQTLREPAAARGVAIVTADPYLYYARLTQWWAARARPPGAAGIHPSAVIDPGARVAASASIGALTVVEAGAVIDDDATIGAQCYVGRDAQVGAGTRFAARVTFNERCRIGRRCTVHGGAVIGADGFGFAPTEGRWEKIEQLGGVLIGDDVDIGANTCIDRGALGDTVVEDGVKLDNLIQIGHNCRIGAHTAIAGNAGIAGSSTIGRHVMIGGAAMIGGHLEIADHVVISGGSTVTHSVRHAGTYTSVFPLDEHAAWEKNAAVVRHLYPLRGRVKALERAAALRTSAAAGAVTAPSVPTPNEADAAP